MGERHRGDELLRRSARCSPSTSPATSARSVERRGSNADRTRSGRWPSCRNCWTSGSSTVWQNRPHDGLRDPLTPGKALTPNEKYAALVETAGYVPVPLAAEDYIELLPVTWRAINAYGIKIGHRTYDGKALNPYRRQHPGSTAQKGLWEVHHDPYDVTRVWVRNHRDGGWIQVPWTHLRTAPAPFGELAWQHARQVLARRGQDPVTEAEIAQAAAALLDKAEQGPAAARTSGGTGRSAGRTRAAATARPVGAAAAAPALQPDSRCR